jgi:hypothetical protein
MTTRCCQKRIVNGTLSSNDNNVMTMKVVMKTDSVAFASCDKEVVFLTYHL